MVTNAGGGYSRWNEFNIYRWVADTTSDFLGSYCYIKDRQTNALWGTAYHPTETKGMRYSVHFKADKVEIHRRDSGIEMTQEIVVSPEDDAEVRLITLVNLSKKVRKLELTSYSELSLAPHNVDKTHPTFNKLFIETEKLEDNALLAFRRQRASDDTTLFAIHTVACNHPLDEPLQYETDRSLFIGRGKTLSFPSMIDTPLSNTTGTVLDPIFSLRVKLTLQEGEHVQIAFITAISKSREVAVGLSKKYATIDSSHRAIEMAWSYAQLELRHLRIHQEKAQLFQKLAGRILYPHGSLRPATDYLRRNRKGQSALWAYGISGDLPIVSLTIAEFSEIDIVKDLLTAHTFGAYAVLKWILSSSIKN